jgi:transcription antitermination factor NusA-like protein
MSKDKKETPKEDVPDFEKLYYRAMQEVQMLKNSKASVELSHDEISLLKDLLFEELYELRDKMVMISDPTEDDDDENKMVKEEKPDKNAVLNLMIEERKKRIEELVKKLNLEI